MARIGHSSRSKREGRSLTQNTGRETHSFTNQRLPLDKYGYFKKQAFPLSEIEDRRRFHPEGSRRPATTFRSLPARLKVRNLPLQKGTPYTGQQISEFPTYQLGFINPSRVLVCVRRSVRKQVLFATGFSGRNGGRRYRLTENSRISCK